MNQTNRFNWFYAGLLLIGLSLLFVLTQFSVLAQQSDPDLAELEQRIAQLEQEVANLRNAPGGDLERRVDNLERNIGNLASSGLVIFLYASFCALWAQTKRRSAVLWFIFGGIFNVFAVLLLLFLNWQDRSPDDPLPGK